MGTSIVSGNKERVVAKKIRPENPKTQKEADEEFEKDLLSGITHQEVMMELQKRLAHHFDENGKKIAHKNK